MIDPASILVGHFLSRVAVGAIVVAAVAVVIVVTDAIIARIINAATARRLRREIARLKVDVANTARNFKIVEVSADKAYLSRENVAQVDALGASPFIPFKEGTGTGVVIHGERAPHAELWRKLYHAFQYDRERFLRHYHARSNVESLFAMIKAKFGANIRSKSPVAQQNEALVKVLCHNVVVLTRAVHELGLTPAIGSAA